MHVLLQLIRGVFVNNNHFSHRTRFSIQANVAIHIFLHLPAGSNLGESWELRRAEFLLKYQRCVTVRDLYCNIPSFWQYPNLYPKGPVWRMLALCLTEKNSLKGCSSMCCPWAILLLHILFKADPEKLPGKQASITSLLGFLSCRACHFWAGSYVDSWFTWKPSLSSSRRQWFAGRDHWQREERWADQPLLQEWGGLSPHQQRAEDPERCGWRIQWFIQRGWCPAVCQVVDLPGTLRPPWQLEHSRTKVEK